MYNFSNVTCRCGGAGRHTFGVRGEGRNEKKFFVYNTAAHIANKHDIYVSEMSELSVVSHI